MTDLDAAVKKHDLTMKQATVLVAVAFGEPDVSAEHEALEVLREKGLIHAVWQTTPAAKEMLVACLEPPPEVVVADIDPTGPPMRLTFSVFAARIE
jgi:hypothetical protein